MMGSLAIGLTAVWAVVERWLALVGARFRHLNACTVVGLPGRSSGSLLRCI